MKQLSCLLPLDLMDGLDYIAKTLRCDRTAVVRMAVERYLLEELPKLKNRKTVDIATLMRDLGGE